MGLDSSCKEYLNRIVLVKLVYGFGWSRIDAPDITVPNEVNGVPCPFNCRINDFIYYENRLVGAVGYIEEIQHIYTHLWTFFYLREQGIFNFTDEIGYYNVEIGQQFPEIPVGKEWYEFTSGSPIIFGFGMVGESFRHIEKYRERQNEKWEIMRDTRYDNEPIIEI